MIRPDSCTPNHQATEISRSPSQAVQDKNTRVQNAPNPIHQSKNNNPHRFTAQIDHKTTFLGTSYLEASTSVTKPDSKPLSRDPFIQPPKAVSNGGERVRTDDPLLAKQVLSQLSYTPKRLAPRSPQAPRNSRALRRIDRHALALLCPHIRTDKTQSMGQGGLEPPTPRLSSVCSNQLSY